MNGATGLPVIAVLCLLLTCSGCTSSDRMTQELAGERLVAVAYGDSNTQAWAPSGTGPFPTGWGVGREEQYLAILLRRADAAEDVRFEDLEPWPVEDPRSVRDDRVLVGDDLALVNAGVASATLRDVLALERATPFMSRARVLIVFCGTNDILQARTVAASMGDLREILDDAAGVGAVPIVCSVPPYNGSPEFVAAAGALNNAIRSECRRRGVAFVNLGRVLDKNRDEVNDFPLDGTDMLHFSAEGHEAIASAIPLEEAIAASTRGPEQ